MEGSCSASSEPVQGTHDGAGGPTIMIKVSYGSDQLDVSVAPQSTFGELKRVLAQVTGLAAQDQRLLFRGREKEDNECLHASGVKDMSKMLLLDNPAGKEQKEEEMKMDQGIAMACEAVARVKAEVDKLADKVTALESAVDRGNKLEVKEFVVPTELLMLQLLNLDGIEAEGEAREQRKAEVRRIQNFVEKLDMLKAKNANPFSGRSNAIPVTTQWETFESGTGSLPAPSQVPSSNDWVVFD